MTVAVRALATRALGGVNSRKFVLRELQVGVLNGLGFAAIVGIIAGLWFGSRDLGLVIGIAIIVNLVAAGLAGALIPIALEKAGVDPAVASGPFVTTVTDIVGFFCVSGRCNLVVRAWVSGSTAWPGSCFRFRNQTFARSFKPLRGKVRR